MPKQFSMDGDTICHNPETLYVVCHIFTYCLGYGSREVVPLVWLVSQPDQLCSCAVVQILGYKRKRKIH